MHAIPQNTCMCYMYSSSFRILVFIYDYFLASYRSNAVATFLQYLHSSCHILHRNGTESMHVSTVYISFFSSPTKSGYLLLLSFSRDISMRCYQNRTLHKRDNCNLLQKPLFSSQIPNAFLVSLQSTPSFVLSHHSVARLFLLHLLVLSSSSDICRRSICLASHVFK